MNIKLNLNQIKNKIKYIKFYSEIKFKNTADPSCHSIPEAVVVTFRLTH
jgi:hypothetical protein